MPIVKEPRMGDRAAKSVLFAEFAAVGKALANPGRLELLDLLAQGPRGVDELSDAASMGISTCSAHLQSLREAGLVGSVRDGKRVINFLTDEDVAQLLVNLRSVALKHRPGTDRARRAYLGPEDTEAITRTELLNRAQSGDLVILDVRPEVEFAASHLPGALSIPVEQLEDRLDELPADTEVVAYCRGAYCVMAHDAVRILQARGYRARRAEDGALEWRTDGILRPHTAA
jgi:rhodanese-related sulfurtransferase/DNA-binding transcriptional ArsR family regulator